MATSGANRAELFFAGEFEHALDAQRRIAIPSAWRRDGDAGRFFLLPGRHRALQLVPYAYFHAQLLEKAGRVSFADADAALALARLGALAQECHCDRQGRIALPQRLLEYAGLRDSAVLVGALTTVQIWAPEAWRRMQTSDEQVLDVIQRIGERPDDLLAILKGKV